MLAGRPERACGADLVRCALSCPAREDSAISGACAWQSAVNVLRALLWECMMIYHAPAPVHGRSGGACPPCTLAGQTPWDGKKGTRNKGVGWVHDAVARAKGQHISAIPTPVYCAVPNMNLGGAPNGKRDSTFLREREIREKSDPALKEARLEEERADPPLSG